MIEETFSKAKDIYQFIGNRTSVKRQKGILNLFAALEKEFDILDKIEVRIVKVENYQDRPTQEVDNKALMDERECRSYAYGQTFVERKVGISRSNTVCSGIFDDSDMVDDAGNPAEYYIAVVYYRSESWN